MTSCVRWPSSNLIQRNGPTVGSACGAFKIILGRRLGHVKVSQFKQISACMYFLNGELKSRFPAASPKWEGSCCLRGLHLVELAGTTKRKHVHQMDCLKLILQIVQESGIFWWWMNLNVRVVFFCLAAGLVVSVGFPYLFPLVEESSASAGQPNSRWDPAIFCQNTGLVKNRICNS